jgi:hypothetical protein
MITATALPASFAQQPPDASAWLQFIGLELRQLRVEMLEQRVVEETDRALQLERELAALRVEQNKRQGEEQSQKRQLAELDKDAGELSPDSLARAQMQVLKGELAASADITRGAYSSLVAREAELNERLRSAKTRLQTIMGRLKQLGTNNP